MHVDFLHEGRAIDNWKSSYIWFPLQITSYRSAFEIPDLHKENEKSYTPTNPEPQNSS